MTLSASGDGLNKIRVVAEPSFGVVGSAFLTGNGGVFVEVWEGEAGGRVLDGFGGQFTAGFVEGATDLGDSGCAESIVRVLRNAIGFGDTGGDAGGGLRDSGHLSSTELFFPGFSGVDGRELEGVSNRLLTLTMFCTKPRPWRRLKLGVVSF